MEKSEDFHQLRVLLDEYRRLRYFLKRSGLSGKLIREDQQLSELWTNINALANVEGFSKTRLRRLLAETTQNRKSIQSSRLREARKTPGLKAKKKLRSNAVSRTSGSSVYALPKTIKHWSR